MSSIRCNRVCSMGMTSYSKMFAMQLDYKFRSPFPREMSTLLLVSDHSVANAWMPISIREIA